MATLKDVAIECGLSLPTVSQIFGSRSHLFSEETRSKVFETAKRLGYKRHIGATNLAKGKTNTIFVVMQGLDKLATSDHMRAFIGFTESAAHHKQQICIASLSDQNVSDDDTIHTLLGEKICDGVIFNIVMPDPVMDEIEKLFDKEKLPILWLNTPRKLNAVCPDESRAAEFLAQKLLQNGHKHIIYIGVSNGIHFSAAARPGFLEEHFKRLGGKTVKKIDNWKTAECFRKKLRAFFEKPENTTAMVLYSETSLLSVFAIASESGLQMPNGFPYAIFDTPIDNSPSSIRLKHTAAAPDFRLLGQHAVDLLMERINDYRDLPSVFIEPICADTASLKC